MAEAGDGAVHGVNTSWIDHAGERAGTDSLHRLEQLIAAIKDRASERREHEHITTSGDHWNRRFVRLLDIHSLLADRSTASPFSSGSFQAVLTLGQRKAFDRSDINPAKMFLSSGMQECANRIADKEICVFCAVKFGLKTLRKFSSFVAFGSAQPRRSKWCAQYSLRMLPAFIEESATLIENAQNLQFVSFDAIDHRKRSLANRVFKGIFEVIRRMPDVRVLEIS